MIRRLGIFRAVTIVLVAAGLAFAWSWYQSAEWLRHGFPPYFEALLPTYSHERTELPAEASWTRLAEAIAASTAMLAMLLVALWRRWRTSVCLAIAFVAVLVINVGVARMVEGDVSLYRPFARSGLEYFGDVRFVRDDPIKFIADYPKLASRFFSRLSHHAGTHPPGGVLFLWVGGKLFGTGVKAASWLTIVFTALSIFPAYVLARSIGGAAAARRMLPLYITAPTLILFGATCMDGVFMTFIVSAMAAGFVAMRRGSRVWSVVRPIVAGMLLWLATFMTYSTVAVPLLMGCFTIAIGLRKPKTAAMMMVRALYVGVVALACQLAAERWLHYDFRACVNSAMRIDENGVQVTGYDSFEIWRDLSLGNALAFIFASGLAACGLFFVSFAYRIWFKRPAAYRTRAFVPAYLACMAALACSTLFTLETERVWMFLVPPLLIAGTVAYRGTIVWLVTPALMLAQAIYVEWFYYTWW